MTWADDDLRTLAGTARPRGRRGCPEPDALGALARGEVAAGRREELVDHLVGCSPCSRELQGLLALAELDDGGDVADGRRGSARLLRSASWGWLAAAAAVACFAVGLSLLREQGKVVAPPPSASDRGSEGSAAERVPENGAVLRSAPGTLAWGERGDAYRVTVADVEGTVLWTSGWVEQPSVVLPPPLVERLDAGGRFHWLVEVLSHGERRRAPPSWFEVAR